VLGDRILIAAERGQRPLARRARVGHRLQRREGLGGDDEQRLRRVEVARRLGEVGAVNVGDEAEGPISIGVVAKRLVGHHRSEVRAPDADVDDVPNRLAGVATPLAAAHPIRERPHSVEHVVDLDHHVLAVDDQGTIAGHPQCDMEHGTVLGAVDVLASEHGLAPLGEAGFVGEARQELDRLVVDAVLRVVEEQARRLGNQSLTAPGVRREELAEVGAARLGVMTLERLEAFALAQRAHAGRPSMVRRL
jgi:hypothetical protein